MLKQQVSKLTEDQCFLLNENQQLQSYKSLASELENNNKKIISELIKDKQELKIQMKLYKRKIRKQKCKFKALYKVISEQHSLQLIPQIKKQVELELNCQNMNREDNYNNIHNASVSSNQNACQNTMATYETLLHQSKNCDIRHPRSISTKKEKIIQKDKYNSNINQSSNSLIKILPDQSVECKVFNYEKEVNSSTETPICESADLGEYLDFQRSQSKYAHSRKQSQSVYSISKFKDKHSQNFDSKANKRLSGVIQKNNVFNTHHQRNGNFETTQLLSRHNNPQFSGFEARRIENNQTPIREITNIIQPHEALDLDSKHRIFKSMDDQSLKSPENLKSLSDINELCVDASDSCAGTQNSATQEIEVNENINTQNNTTKHSRPTHTQSSHTKSMQDISRNKLGMNLRKMGDISEQKPSMTFGSKTGELKTALENSENINSFENAENSQIKDQSEIKHALSKNTIGLLKEIEDIDEEIRGLLSLIAKH